MMANKKLVLDAGHGYNTSGKRTKATLGKQYREWSLNNAVCNYIAQYLKDYDSIMEASRENGLKSYSPIGECCNGKKKLLKDYIGDFMKHLYN